MSKPDADAKLDSFDGKVSVLIPAGSADDDLRIEYTQFTPPASEGMRFIKTFELKAYATKRGDAVVSQFKKDLTITLKHDEADLAGIDVSSLRLYYLDEHTQKWVPQNSQYDPLSKKLTVTTNHFTYEGEIGASLQSGPGRVMAFETDLHSGAAVASYPLEVPDGPGGLKPKLSFTYSSGAVDSMKDKRATGSWVGIGWTLAMERISYDSAAGKYYLEFNGASYELVNSAGVWYTLPDQGYKITRSGMQWDLRDKSGVHYRFGGSDNSIQSYYQEGAQSPTYYRYDLDLIEDTHVNGENHVNQITIEYVKDIVTRDSHQSVRSAYPLDIKYNFDSSTPPKALVNIHFNSSSDIPNDPADGNLRTDNPKTPQTGGPYKAPIIMENKKLNSIEVKVGPADPMVLVRKYVFDYVTTPSFENTSDYYPNSIYYSGAHKLDKVTEYGSDGTSHLNAMTFTYVDGVLSGYDGGTPTYPGNPGNPATITWPYLQTANSGYGGSVTYSYSQTGGGTWSRQKVDTRTVNPGAIGTSQTYNITYSAAPEYKGTGWNQEYRGFRQVTETDAAGNYVVHYYYTTGTIENKDTEKLTGKEYKAEWHALGGALLRKVESDWDWKYFGDNNTLIWSSTTPLGGIGSDTDSGGNTYVVQGWGQRIKRINSDGTGQDATQQPINLSTNDLVYLGGYYYVLGAWEGNMAVHKYDSDGFEVSGGWGGNGSGDGQFNGAINMTYKNGFFYVADQLNNRVQVFGSSGNFLGWIGKGQQPPYGWHGPNSGQTGVAGTEDGAFSSPRGVAADANGNIFVADTGNNRIQKFSSSRVFLAKTTMNAPAAVATDSEGYVYVLAMYGNSIGKFYGSNLASAGSWGVSSPLDIAVADGTHSDVNTYVLHTASTYGDTVKKFGKKLYRVWLKNVKETTGVKARQTNYEYDDYGNVVRVRLDGDLGSTGDESMIVREYYPNTSLWVMNRVARESVYEGQTEGQQYLKQQTEYYYDGATNWTTPPTEGDVTRVRRMVTSSTSIYTGYEYDLYGNVTGQIDPNNFDSNGNVIDPLNKTSFAYDGTYHTFMVTKTYPPIGGSSMSESWDYTKYYYVTPPSPPNPPTTHTVVHTGVNGSISIVTYFYDALWRPLTVIKPGDDETNPTVKYDGYGTWGTVGQQYVQVQTKTSGTDYQWQKFFFDGVGRIVQTQSRGETEGATTYAMVGTKTYNNRGLVDKEYVPQKINTTTDPLNGYKEPPQPPNEWKSTSYVYDGLGRVTSQTNPDSTSVSHTFVDWKDTVTDPLSHKKVYYNDAFGRLTKVEELNASYAVYATTNYTYDVLSNLKTVVDAASNTTTVNYDWLSRKTSMADPDMGTWYYKYDPSGNLASQVDAKAQAINMYYDALNRLKGKTYATGVSDPPNYTRPTDPGSYTVGYTYDSTTSGNYGKGLRTGVTYSGNSDSTKYDARGRVIQEVRTIDSATYPTSYTYDSMDRLVTVTYPGNETVTQHHNGRGLPSTLTTNVYISQYVDSSLYNNLGQITDMSLLLYSATQTFGYWGTGGTHDNPNGGYYGKLWEVQSLDSMATVRQDLKYTWDAAGNLTQRQDVLAPFTEDFTYDFLDRLTGAQVGQQTTLSQSYNEIGNITVSNGVSYGYPNGPQPRVRPHAVTSVGSTNYVYDANGNMTDLGSQDITWNVENRPVTVTGGATFHYDGDGNRYKKLENNQRIIYVNKYYEINLDTTEETRYYYFGVRMVVFKKGGTFGDYYVVGQDQLGGTSTTMYFGYDPVSTITYEPFGATRSIAGTMPTDKLFTGQRLDGTGLYYYNARYYDATIGRFISADTIVPNFADPQALNRYSYVLNNPLRYADPSGHRIVAGDTAAANALFDLISTLQQNPALADLLDRITALVNSDTVYTVGTADQSGAGVTISAAGMILLAPGQTAEGAQITLAHELYHLSEHPNPIAGSYAELAGNFALSPARFQWLMGDHLTTTAEEIEAYRMSFRMTVALGLTPDDFTRAMSMFNSGADFSVAAAKAYLLRETSGAVRVVYDAEPLRASSFPILGQMINGRLAIELYLKTGLFLLLQAYSRYAIVI